MRKMIITRTIAVRTRMITRDIRVHDEVSNLSRQVAVFFARKSNSRFKEKSGRYNANDGS